MKKIVTNLTRDGLILLEEGAKSELYLQIIKVEEIKREKTGKTPNPNRYYKYIFLYFLHKFGSFKAFC